MSTPKTDSFRQRIPDPVAVQEMLASHGDLERGNTELLVALCRLTKRSNGCLGKNPWAVPEFVEAIQAIGNQIGVSDKYAVDESVFYRRIAS